jgi:hypothetical protein
VAARAGDEAFERWRGALLDALGSPAGVMTWQDRRFQFAHQVGGLLAGPADDVGPVTGPALYGVWIAGAGLLYIGQSSEAQRRLRDLPVGESHHLATTVPPETWERVVVVEWPGLLVSVPDREVRAVERLGPRICGLALEHRLQVTYRPVMSTRRRGASGSWTERRLDSSRSAGAINGAEFTALFAAVQSVWAQLAEVPEPVFGPAVSYTRGGRVVFPAALLQAGQDV